MCPGNVQFCFKYTVLNLGSGPEHHPNTGTPSYCTLSIFHRPITDSQRVPGGVGYISPDGHHFSCRKSMSEAYHM